MKDFWLESVTKAMECAGIEATNIQINKVAGFIEGCYIVETAINEDKSNKES